MRWAKPELFIYPTAMSAAATNIIDLTLDEEELPAIPSINYASEVEFPSEDETAVKPKMIKKKKKSPLSLSPIIKKKNKLTASQRYKKTHGEEPSAKIKKSLETLEKELDEYEIEAEESRAILNNTAHPFNEEWTSKAWHQAVLKREEKKIRSLKIKISKYIKEASPSVPYSLYYEQFKNEFANSFNNKIN